MGPFTYFWKFHGKLISQLAIHWCKYTFFSKLSMTGEKADLSFGIPADIFAKTLFTRFFE